MNMVMTVNAILLPHYCTRYFIARHVDCIQSRALYQRGSKNPDRLLNIKASNPFTDLSGEF